MRKLKSLFTFILLFLLTQISYAQNDGDKVDMADTMRSNGRIYVVVAVVVLILIGLILYLVRLDRKITRMEKENR
jgi:CcmD family protein